VRVQGTRAIAGCARRTPTHHRGPDKFSNLSHDAAAPPRPGERPSVSWLVETFNCKPTLPQHAQLPPRTFPEGELFHSPGLPRQRLPGVPAPKKSRKPVGLRLNAARPTAFAGSTRCATGERHSTRWPETDRTSRRGSAQEGKAPNNESGHLSTCHQGGPDKFSHLSHHAAAPPRASPLSRKTTPGQRHPQIAPNERRSVGPKCGPSRLRVRSPTSDSPSARGRRGLVREGRDSVLATDLAHHRLEADGVGHAGTRRARSLSHKERTTHQSPSRARHSVRPIGHLRTTLAIHQDPTLLAGVGESDRRLARGPAARGPPSPAK
jgi:hypothetical protein